MHNGMKLVVTLLSLCILSGCAGYAVYGDTGRKELHNAALFGETTDMRYASGQGSHYRAAKISSTDVIEVWGQPDSIKPYNHTLKYATSDSPAVYEEGEKWTYKKGLSFGGFMPIVIIPIPLFWWPNGFNETYVHMRNGYVSHVTKQSNEMDLKYLCVIPFSLEFGCVKTLNLH